MFDQQQNKREQNKTEYDQIPELNPKYPSKFMIHNSTREMVFLTSLEGEDLIRQPSQLALGTD